MFWLEWGRGATRRSVRAALVWVVHDFQAADGHLMVEHLLPVELSRGADGAAIAVLTLEQPGRPVVVIDEDLLSRLNATLETLPEDLGGFVLASSAERAFVAGADLKAIMSMDDAALHAYLENGARVFQRIADLGCPTAAAIHSVALGGGLELAMHCDALFGLVGDDVKPFLIGLPEAGLKICPGWGGTNLLPARMDAEDAILATATGVAMKSDAAHAAGMFDGVAGTREGLIEAAKAWVLSAGTPERGGRPSRCISSMDPGEVKKALDAVRSGVERAEHTDAVCGCVQAGLDGGWGVALQKERDELVRLRHTEPAKDAIGAFLNRGKK